jgi:hypothetical protein
VNTGGKFAIVSLRLAANLPSNIGGYNIHGIYIDCGGDTSTGGKFAAGVNKAGGYLATGNNDTDK